MIAGLMYQNNEFWPRLSIMLSQCPYSRCILSASPTPPFAVKKIEILDKKQCDGVWDNWNELGENVTARIKDVQKTYQRQGQCKET